MHGIQHAFAVGGEGGAKVKITVGALFFAEGNMDINACHGAKISHVATSSDEIEVRAYFL